MKLNTVDLHQRLRRIRSKERRLPLLEEVTAIYKQEALNENAIGERLKKGGDKVEIATEVLDQEHIYTLEQIKKLCVKYRLRFLDSKVFKGEIPYEAIIKIKALEKKWGVTLSGFKIVAPKELFKLEDKDSDPMLFLQLSENRFYFIHKWGGEINLFRSLLALPLRDFMSMFWFLALVSFLFSLAIPTKSIDVFAFLFVHSFIAICGIACMLVFSLRENFSNVEWDSKFFS